MNWKYLENELFVGDTKLAPSSARALSEMRQVLKNPGAKGPDPVYLVFRGVPDQAAQAGIRSDITIINPGTLGNEYTKTHGHYHLGEGVESYKVLSGEAVLILQKPNYDLEGVEAVRVVKLSPSQTVEIPAGWGHTLVNIGPTPLIAENFEPPTIEQLYSAYKKKHGAAYYVLDQDGQMKIEPNKNYGEVPKPQTF
jgi:glucose-6-phosphate isomerase